MTEEKLIIERVRDNTYVSTNRSYWIAMFLFIFIQLKLGHFIRKSKNTTYLFVNSETIL